MKKLKWYITPVLFLILCIPNVVLAANACSATIDKNGYCDETGEYHDPSISTIKSNNCTSYKKDIVKGYCSTICREDATTKFPNKVPMVSVDQYDSILGGSHFIWEEIATTRIRECETTINWDKWKKEWEDVTGTPNGQLNKSGIAQLVLHIAREDHQRNSDLKVCDLIDGVFEDEKIEKFYQSYDPTASPRGIEYLAKFAGVSASDKEGMKRFYGCGKYANEFGYCAGNKCYAPEIGVTDNGTAEDCMRQLKNKWGAIANQYEVSNMIPYKQSGSTNERTGKWCVFKHKTIKSNKGYCSAGKVRIWSKVNFDNLEAGMLDANYQTYCDGQTIPYNSVDYDKDLGDYKVEGAKDDGVGGNAYRLSLSSMKEKIKRLESILRTCNTSGNNANNQSDTSTITVNYLDNPTNTYKRNILLNKTRIGNQKVTGHTTKASNPTIYTSTCTEVSASKLSYLISINDLPSIIGSTTCQRKEYTNLSQYANTAIYSKVEEKFKYSMPSNTYRYVQKTDGKAVDRVTGTIAANKSYIDIGYPNYPVSFQTPTGTYPISLTYKNIGIDGHFVKNATYSCKYKVVNRILPCSGDDCDEPTPPGGNKLKGINVIYRPISLTNPFPGESGTGRNAGTNWSNKDITDYITNNRKAKQNLIYKETPLYSFTLTANSIKQIKNYNAKTKYDDFNLKCTQPYGKRCKSDFLKNITNYGVKVNSSKCYNVGTGSFYSCAAKPNQENIKCYWKSKDKKLECVNCSKGEGHENDAICKEGSDK